MLDDWLARLNADERENLKAYYTEVRPEVKKWYRSLATAGLTSNLLLKGPPGTHKTTDAKFGVLHLLDEIQENGENRIDVTSLSNFNETSGDIRYLRFEDFFMSSRDRMSHFAETAQRGRMELERLWGYKVLILDEIGTTALPQETLMHFSRLMDQRWDTKLPTVFITNAPSIKELFPDRRIQDRLLGRSQEVIYNGPSSRRIRQ